MATWTVSPGTHGNTLKGKIQYEGSDYNWGIQQDINPYLKQAEEDRQLGDGNKHYTKMYSIPEIVAIEIKEKWGIDVFSPEFMHDKEMKAKVHVIVQQHYPKLLSTDKKI